MIKEKLWIILLCFSVYSLNAESADIKIVDLEKRPCPQGVYPLEGSPFSVLISCEDALGKYITILYSKKMAKPLDGSWRIDNRSWGEKPWNSDVTSFAVSPDGKDLYISTSEIYGDGGIYKIDLFRRKSKQLNKKTIKNESVYKIVKIDFDTKLLEFTLDDDGHLTTHSVSIQ